MMGKQPAHFALNPGLGARRLQGLGLDELDRENGRLSALLERLPDIKNAA